MRTNLFRASYWTKGQPFVFFFSVLNCCPQLTSDIFKNNLETSENDLKETVISNFTCSARRFFSSKIIREKKKCILGKKIHI